MIRLSTSLFMLLLIMLLTKHYVLSTFMLDEVNWGIEPAFRSIAHTKVTHYPDELQDKLC